MDANNKRTLICGLLATALGSILAAQSVAIKLPNVTPVKLTPIAALEGAAGQQRGLRHRSQPPMAGHLLGTQRFRGTKPESIRWIGTAA